MTEATEIDCSNRNTIDRLYKLMAGPAIAKAISVVRRQDVANEIVQEVFIKLWQGKGKFPNDKAVYSWIYKACQRAGIDYLRSARYRREVYSDDYTDQAQCVEDGFEVATCIVSRETIRRCLMDLSEEEAGILIFSVIDRMTQVEIGEMLGVSRRTVQRVIARVEEKLIKIREKYGNERQK